MKLPKQKETNDTVSLNANTIKIHFWLKNEMAETKRN
jgi:hypothetical protein